MVKPNPGVLRAVAALEYLAARPRHAATLSEIGRACGLNLTSTLSALEALVSVGYVSRDPRRKTYRLGPALIAAGEAARIQHVSVAIAEEELRLLAADLTAPCNVAARAGEYLVTLVSVGRPRSATVEAHVGARLPFVPPFGAVFAAWGTDEEADAWIAHAHGDPVIRSRLREALAEIRDQGFAMSTESRARADLVGAMGRFDGRWAAMALDAESRRYIDELADDFLHTIRAGSDAKDIAAISLPIFDAHRNAELILTVHGFQHGLSYLEARSVVTRAQAVASVITQRGSGFES